MNSVKIVNFYACLVILTILCEGIATPVCVEKDVDEFKTFMQNVSKLYCNTRKLINTQTIIKLGTEMKP